MASVSFRIFWLSSFMDGLAIRRSIRFSAIVRHEAKFSMSVTLDEILDKAMNSGSSSIVVQAGKLPKIVGGLSGQISQNACMLWRDENQNAVSSSRGHEFVLVPHAATFLNPGLLSHSMFGKKSSRDSADAGFPMDEKQNKKIEKRLDPREKVVMSIRQSRIKVGGSPVTPNSVFITPKQIIIRNPTRMGLGEQVEDFLYDDITNVRLERGMTSSSLVFTIPGLMEMSKMERSTNSKTYNIWGRDTPGTIDAIPRDKAEKAYKYIRERIQGAKEKRQEVKIVGGAAPSQNPLDALKMRYVNGEITEGEYERMKKILEG